MAMTATTVYFRSHGVWLFGFIALKAYDTGAVWPKIVRIRFSKSALEKGFVM
jgi:hypothetical protein